ncbi:MAG: PAS domain-containing protein [Magnetococcales bacterium]|nr:PAS domain-containing protein [Magnetococcales bacterium]
MPSQNYPHPSTLWQNQALLFLLIMAMGALPIYQMERMIEATEQLYHRAFKTNLAAHDTKTALTRMHARMHELLHDHSDKAVQHLLLEMHDLKARINDNLLIIDSRFFGHEELLVQFREACTRGRQLYQEAVDLVLTGDMTRTKRLLEQIQQMRHNELEPLIDEVIRISELNALTFHQETKTRHYHALIEIALFVILVIVTALLIIRWQYRHFQQLDRERRLSLEIIHRNIIDLGMSESRLWGVINNSNALISLKDQEGRFILVSRRFEEIFDTTDPRIRGKRGEEVFTPELFQCHQEHERRVRERGGLVEQEIAIPHAGETRTFLSVKFPLIDDGGQAIGIGSIDTDITELKRTEASLRQINATLEALFQTSHLAMVILDRDFNFIRVNRAYAEKCAREIDFFPGKNHFALYPHAENQRIFQTVVETGEPFSILAKPFEYPDHPEWGVTYWDWSLHPLVDGDNRVVLLLFTLLDVTLPKRNEIDLQNTNAMLRSILDTIPSRVYWKDEQAIFQGCNRAFAQSLHLDNEQEIVGLRAEDPPLRDRLGATHQDDRQVIRNGHAIGPFSEFFSKPDGSPCWLSTTKIPLHDSLDRTIGLLGISEEITQIKLAAEERGRLQEQVYLNDRLASMGFLAAGIAHEVNNPNNIIVLNISMIQEVWRDARKILDHFYQENGDFSLGGTPYSEMADPVSTLMLGIEENARRIHAIIRNLKTLSHTKPPKKMEPVDLAEVIERSVSFLQERIKRHTRTFRTEWQPGVYKIQGNPEKLFQIFTNLIMNALQSLPDTNHGVTVAMFTDSDLASIRVEVRDQGCGIAPEDLSRLGTPFFTTRQEQGGMGMGFSITKKIMELHQGILEVHSQPNRGTTVSLRFPVTN